MDGDCAYFIASIGGGAWVHNEKCWITKDSYQAAKTHGTLNKFLRAMERGHVGPVGEAGIKELDPPYNDYTHELKIMGSAARILGKLDNWRGNSVMIFSKFTSRGLH